ncbi:DNA-formamidopyrimidine glycosylase [Lactobacillus hominis]|uniref:Formamidopyrimidine-DNA glycosylase n=1 Tax=Lactobacillus hominis DSM 23910 = CRBIP 24.179 TaxID=1423758 RepID=I7IVP0_9LACO|nr:DNA-formamidopyrimidine glycosylase [Lactobacillus hominis]KRM85700.1 DNA-(apurinic or apyrimidinic site) lyase [Lactobacillus hominis DSM 23910 = CRBIP 24.179]MCT3347251.1 DNA-formamidopyrimidine glycosylase [Lactobacillus hominis]CCI81778.1 Formamidopyrimidine-DNA glycosylase [Lactobacillus hominis DSM 23910 = CRBIP 24.179]
MPEMPEVETVRRTLEPLIKGKTIKKVTVWYPKIIMGDSQKVADRLQNKTILGIDRYGKYLLIRLSDDLTLVSHLRMEGKYRLVAKDTPKQKHEHVQFLFDDGTALRYDDVRKFGRMHLVETGTERQTTGIRHLGPEPNSSEFTFNYLKGQLAKKKKNIKTSILDQSIVCGLGNIYVDEVLWQSKIHPLSTPAKIPVKQVKVLYDSINATIENATELRGTTVHTFLDADGMMGGYQDRLQVYGHAGQECPRCGTILEKIKVNGRGTTFCPHCQVVYK